MEYTEKTSTSPITGEYRFIERINDDGTITIIPIDQANSDYQRYLNPEAEQSTPNLAD
jgi:hypothetical protein